MKNKQRLIDTNLIVRHLVQDHEHYAKAAGKLFEACDRGDVTLLLLPAVVAECVFVLESFYRHDRKSIASCIASLIESPGISLADVTVHLDALARYGASKLHFIDCMLAAHALANGIPIATFDNDLKKLPGISVETP